MTQSKIAMFGSTRLGKSQEIQKEVLRFTNFNIIIVGSVTSVHGNIEHGNSGYSTHFL
jgi:hypothetical protein